MTNLEDAYFYDGTPLKVCRTRITGTFGPIYSVFFVAFFVLSFFILAIIYSKIARIPTSYLQERTDSHKHSSFPETSSTHACYHNHYFLRNLSSDPLLIFTPVEKVTSVDLEAFLNIISFARIMKYKCK